MQHGKEKKDGHRYITLFFLSPAGSLLSDETVKMYTFFKAEIFDGSERRTRGGELKA